MSHQASHDQYTEISVSVDLFSTNTDTYFFIKVNTNIMLLDPD